MDRQCQKSVTKNIDVAEHRSLNWLSEDETCIRTELCVKDERSSTEYGVQMFMSLGQMQYYCRFDSAETANRVYQVTVGYTAIFQGFPMQPESKPV